MIANVSIFLMLFFNTGCNKHCVEPTCDSCVESQAVNGQYADTLSTEIKIQNLDLFLQEKESQGQWFTVLYAENSNVMYAKGFGCAEACKIKNAWSTMFDIGSLTKIFTATAIVQLQELGKLTYSDKLQDYFPDISSDKKDITIHQLLTHSSGLEAFHDKKGDFEKMDKDDAVKKICKQDLLFSPGTSFGYSNSGFTLLAYIVEDLSGLSFSKYCAENIFNPLGMNRTAFHGDFAMEPDMAVGYGDKCYNENNPGTWPKPSGALVGNGGAVSTTEDLLKFVSQIKTIALLPSSWDIMSYPYLINTRYDGVFSNNVYQGYGWNIYDHPSIGKTIFMGGSNDYGFVSRLKYYEASGAVLVIMTNNFKEGTKNSVISESVIQEIENILF